MITEWFSEETMISLQPLGSEIVGRFFGKEEKKEGEGKGEEKEEKAGAPHSPKSGWSTWPKSRKKKEEEEKRKGREEERTKDYR